ncbi:MAG: hypothetical protein MZV49_13505 [Rhodopseudomonas palustris]|nr:hypothetical protein [Rhodopseudomonas palustris]
MTGKCLGRRDRDLQILGGQFRGGVLLSLQRQKSQFLGHEGNRELEDGKKRLVAQDRDDEAGGTLYLRKNGTPTAARSPWKKRVKFLPERQVVSKAWFR